MCCLFDVCSLIVYMYYCHFTANEAILSHMITFLNDKVILVSLYICTLIIYMYMSTGCNGGIVSLSSILTVSLSFPPV